MRLRTVRDEKLAAASVPPRQRHPDRAPQVRFMVQFVANRVAGPAVAVAAWVPSLYDEVGHDAVERQPVEVTFARERDEVGGGDRRVEHIELYFDRALRRLDEHVRRYGRDDQ